MSTLEDVLKDIYSDISKNAQTAQSTNDYSDTLDNLLEINTEVQNNEDWKAKGKGEDFNLHIAPKILKSLGDISVLDSMNVDSIQGLSAEEIQNATPHYLVQYLAYALKSNTDISIYFLPLCKKIQNTRN